MERKVYLPRVNKRASSRWSEVLTFNPTAREDEMLSQPQKRKETERLWNNRIRTITQSAETGTKRTTPFNVTNRHTREQSKPFFPFCKTYKPLPGRLPSLLASISIQFLQLHQTNPFHTITAHRNPQPPQSTIPHQNLHTHPHQKMSPPSPLLITFITLTFLAVLLAIFYAVRHNRQDRKNPLPEVDVEAARTARAGHQNHHVRHGGQDTATKYPNRGGAGERAARHAGHVYR